MAKCPICKKDLTQTTGKRKLCAQIGDPDIAIVGVENPKLCSCCNQYFLNTKEVISAITQIQSSLNENKTEIKKGIYT